MNVLDRQGIARIHNQALELFIKHPPKHLDQFSLRVTSGTSGGLPLLAIAEHAISLKTYSSLFWGAKRILVCVGTRSLRFFYTALISENPADCASLALDRADLSDMAPNLLNDFAPDRIIGFPSFIVACARDFDDRAARGVLSITCVGELITPQHQAFFTKKFPGARLSWFYGAIEVRNPSKESCCFLSPNQYHPNSGVTIEVANQDSDGFGDILVTTTAYGGIPITRYRIGDVGRFCPGTCPCGEDVTFELAGRGGGDYLKLGGALLVRQEFDRVTSLWGESVADYRVDASMTEGEVPRGRILIRAYARHMPSSALREEIARRISAELFLTAKETLDDLVREGFFEPLAMEWTADPFPDAHKSVRLRRV